MRTAILALSLLLLAIPAQAATYYVDCAHGSASDDGPGTSESAPWLTLHRAVDGWPNREVGYNTSFPGPYSPVVAGDIVYVKPCTYTDNTTASLGDDTIKYNPTNSGTSGNPITFRRVPGLARPVVSRQLHATQAGANNPVIGCGGANKNYITWSGFELAADTDARLDGGSESNAATSTGCILEDLYIDKGTPEDFVCCSGNWSGIFVEATTDAIIRNCDIRNVIYPGGELNENAAAIKVYGSDGIRIHNNDITSSNVGIFLKTSTRNSIVELNRIYLTHFAALWVANVNAVRTAYGDTLRYNLLLNPGDAGLMVRGSNQIKDIRFYNNTVWGGTAATSSVIASSPGRISALVNAGPTLATTGDERPVWIYNNILVRNSSDSSSPRGQEVFDGASPGSNQGIITGSLVDYNLFWGTGGAHFNAQQFSGGTVTTSLATWQGITGTPDLNSIAGSDPLFQGTGGSNTATDYQLQGGSPAVNAGRVGGVSGGAAVNIGAYATGSETIGIVATSAASVRPRVVRRFRVAGLPMIPAVVATIFAVRRLQRVRLN